MTKKKLIPSSLSILTIGVVVFFCFCTKLNILTPLLSLYVVLPLLAFALIWHYRELKKIPVRLLDIVLLAIFVYEVLNPFFVPRAATAAFWSIFPIVALLLYFLLRWGLDPKHLPLLYHAFTLVALAAGCTGIHSFVNFVHRLTDAGFTMDQIIPLRFLYIPYNLMQNDWATLLLWLLPFPILSAHYLKEKYRIFPIIIFAICLYAILLTLSRGIFLALAVFGSLAVVSVWRSKCPLSWNKKKYYLLLVVFFVALIPIRKPILNVVRAHATVVQQQSTAGRFGLWDRCFEIIKDHPTFGIGSRSFGYENMKLCYRNQLTVTNKTTNVYLQILAEKGCVGAGLYLILAACIGYLLWRGFRHKQAKDPLTQCAAFAVFLAIALREFTFSTLFDLDIAFILFCVWLYILQHNATAQETAAKPAIVGVTKPIACIVTITTLVLLAGGYAVAYRHYYRSKFTMHMNQNVVYYYNENKLDIARSFLNSLPQHQNISPIVTFNRALLDIRPSDTLSFDAMLRTDTLPDYQSEHTNDLISKMERAYYEAPEFTLLSQNMGWLYLLNGHTEEACDVWEQGLLYKPNAVTLLLSLGMYNESQHNREQAVQYYAKALSHAPYTVESPFYISLGRRDSTLANLALQQAIAQLDTPQATLQERVRLAKLWYTSHQDDNRAQQLLEEAVSAVPNLNRAWLTLGDIYYRQHNLGGAAACYKKSLFLDGVDYLASHRLYLVSRDLGNKNAQENYRRQTLYTYQQRFAATEAIKHILYYDYLPNVQYPMNINTYLYPAIYF